jgi:hypothetical protein
MFLLSLLSNGSLEYLHRNPTSRKRHRGGGGEPGVRGFYWATLFLGIWMWGLGPPVEVSLKWDSNIWLRVLRDSHQWVMCTAKYRPVHSSERALYMKKQIHARLKNVSNLIIGPEGRPDTKTYWPTDRRSQIQLHFTQFGARQRLGKYVPAATNVHNRRIIDRITVYTICVLSKMILWVLGCNPFSLLGNNSVMAFPWQREIVRPGGLL